MPFPRRWGSMASAELESLRPELEERLDGMVRKLGAARGVRHAIVAVAGSDGASLRVGAMGSADGAGAPMTADTPYFQASVTKLYIATAVLRLMEQGRVSLDAPMAEYLSADLVAGLHILEGEDRTAGVAG